MYVVIRETKRREKWIFQEGIGQARCFKRKAMNVLEVEGLTKRYRHALALDKLTFQVAKGEIVGYEEDG